MKIKASLLAGLIASAPFALAQVEVATDPVGYVSVDLTAASDTRISVPVTRAPEFQGIPESVSGNSITFAAGTGLQLTESAYFVAVRDGTLAGTRATVVGTEDGGDTLVLEDGADLTGLATGEGGDPVQLIPHWTLASLFPADLADQTQVLVFDLTTAGTNLGAASSYTFFEGFGWFEGGTEADDVVIHQGESFIVRDSAGADQTLVMAGSVPMFSQLSTISTVEADRPQDNSVGIAVPANVTLANAGFDAADGDQLLVPANGDTGINKAAARSFTFFDGFGWFEGGTEVDNYELEPGVGYVYRKAGTAAPEDSTWMLTPSYLQ